METLLINLIALCLIGVGVGIGMLIERRQWNKLIEEGKLPRPGQHRPTADN